MIDSVGNVASVLIVGAGNPLAMATLDRLVGPRLKHVFILDSDEEKVAALAARLHESGIEDPRPGTSKADNSAHQPRLVAEAFTVRDVDVAIIAPVGSPLSGDGPVSEISHQIRAGLIDLVTLTVACRAALHSQGHGVVILFSHLAPTPALPTDCGHDIAMSGAAVYAQTLAAEHVANGTKIIAVGVDPTVRKLSPDATSLRFTNQTLAEAATAAKERVSNAKRDVNSTVVEVPKTMIRTVTKRLSRKR